MRFLVVLALIVALIACGGGSTPPAATGTAPGAAPAATSSGPVVTGMVMFDEPVPLSQGATLNLRLLDVTRADAEPVVLASNSEAVAGLPAQFSLPYPEDRVDSIRGYAVDAQVMDQGTVKFVSIGRVPVLTQGKGSTGITVQLAQALTSAVRDPADELQREFGDLEKRLGGLKRFADSRIVGPEGKQIAIGWDGFADDNGVRMVRETISEGENGVRYNRKFAWKDGKLWVAIREQGGTTVRLGWDKEGNLIVKQKNGATDESVADEAAALSRAAKDAYGIASARAPR